MSTKTYFGNNPYASIDVETHSDGSQQYFVYNNVIGLPVYEQDDPDQTPRDFGSYENAAKARYELSEHYHHLTKRSGF